MVCTNCGREFSPSEATVDIWQKPYRGVSLAGLPQEIKAIALCPDCAASRASAKRTLLWTLAIVVGGLFMIGAVGLAIQALRK
jgi:hypothetical protein